MNKRLILLSLNELNFEFLEHYISKGYLPTFKLLFEKYGYRETFSEKEYHLLEPWIQWVSIHTGKTFEQHKVFRLGDISYRDDLDQIWEILERKGLKVAAISPFNARNKVENASFFVPDPWTKTSVTGGQELENFYNSISRIVNNHSTNNFSKKAALDLVKGFFRYVPLKDYGKYIKLAARFKKKATKVTILDELLADVFFHYFKKKQPDFSSLFLNGAAHIQHHYMFNSKAYSGDQTNPEWYCPRGEDPLLDILISYDDIIKRLLNLNHRIIFATGLHQKPHAKKTYYWRLKDHENFLRFIKLDKYSAVYPRMSRDWLIEFDHEEDSAKGEQLLTSIISKKDNISLFTVDNRGKSLFVELVYPNDIPKGFVIGTTDEDFDFDFHDFVSFIAIKNGEHDGIGYLIDTQNPVKQKINAMPVTGIFEEIVGSYD